MSRILTFLALLFCSALLFAQQPIKILFDNDVHCAVDGYARMSTARAQAYETTENVTLVSCGDFVAGSSLGAYSKGEYIVRIMNAIGYGYATLGNHEFDYQLPQLRRLVSQLDAKVVCCNFVREGVGPLFAPYAIEHYEDGSTVAFVGVTTPTTITTSTPAYFMDKKGNLIYTFSSDSLWSVVQRTVDRCRAEGARYVVVLSHLGDDSPSHTSTQLIANTTGIDAVLDGHSHSVIASRQLPNREGQMVQISSTGAHFENIGVLTLADGKCTTQLIPANSLTPDPDVEEFIDDIKREYEREGQRKVGASDVKLESKDANGNRTPRYSETNLGDFCSDALRLTGEADIGLINGGALRSDINPGDIFFNDLYALFPFSNKVSLVKVTGQQLLDNLEIASANLGNDNGGFLQCSGLRYSIDTTVPSSVVCDERGILSKIGETRRVHTVEVYERFFGRWESLDPKKQYTLASLNYLLFDNGNGLNFEGAEVVSRDFASDIQVLEQYIGNLNGHIDQRYASPARRIRFETLMAVVDDTRILREVQVMGGVRASDHIPLGTSEISREGLNENATASSIPYIVEMEPSVVASGENGFVGNTSLRIRGVDATRINVNLNGISLNGAESHNFTWVNILNLSGMTDNLQIQRGVGSSTGGAATLGAAINMKTLSPRTDPYASVDVMYGSWNTRQYGISAGTGISPKGYALDVAYNNLQSDGFVRGGFCDHQSLFISATRYGQKSLLKAIAILGNHNTGITYYGATADLLDLDPTYNSAGMYTNPAGDTLFYDRNGIYFFQRRYQLIYSYQLSPAWNLTALFDLTKGDGSEDTYKDNARFSKYYIDLPGKSDFIIQKEMHNASYTANLSANYESGPLSLALGENFLFYKGNHRSSMVWCQDIDTISMDKPYRWYSNWGNKYDATTFAKLNYEFSSAFSLYADFQFRFVQFSMDGYDSDSSNLAFIENYPFFNPKVGINYLIDNNRRLYFLTGVSHREPTRADIKDRLNSIHASDTIKAETLLDIELGYQRDGRRYSCGINGYAMLYRDQLTPSGDLSSTAFDVLMENVDRSYRIGIELVGGYKVNDKLSFGGNLTLSQNKILGYTFTDFESGVDTVMQVVTANTDLSYSPNIVGALAANYMPIQHLKLQLSGKYVGAMYCDNTSRLVNRQDAYFVLNFKAGYTWPLRSGQKLEAQLAVNNILNNDYRISASTTDYRAGSVYCTRRTYYQQPGINFTARLAFSF